MEFEIFLEVGVAEIALDIMSVSVIGVYAK
jgi:hypothetical protein